VAQSVSFNFRKALFAGRTDETTIILITLDHPDLASPLRVTSDGVDTVSRGDTFIPFPFSLTLPSDAEDAPPRASLLISNVTGQVAAAIRQANPDPPPTVLMELVLASDPDTVEIAAPNFDLLSASYGATSVRGELGTESFAGEPFPARRVTPATHQGAFR
jgi:hypothetical protein